MKERLTLPCRHDNKLYCQCDIALNDIPECFKRSTMTTTQALENLLDELHHMGDQSKSTEATIQQLRGAKKQADLKERQSETLISLKAMQDALMKMQQCIQVNQNSLEEALKMKPARDEQRQGQLQQQQQLKQPEQQEQENRQRNKQENQKLKSNTRNLTVEEQESLYILKSSRMAALGPQNKALQTELHLIKKKESLLQARYAQNESYSGSRTLQAAHALEAKLRGAQIKIKKLENDLQTSQQMAQRYQELYESSQHGSGHQSPNQINEGQRTYRSAVMPKQAPIREQSFIGPSTTVNDVVRKNECLVEENANQQHEIERLKHDNAYLLLQAKASSTDKVSLMHHLTTSEMARLDLTKKCNKLKEQNLQLSQSMTKQAAEWIHAKKEQKQADIKLQLTELGYIAPHGAGERFREHKQKKNVHFPRYMFPAEKYAMTTAA